MDLLTKIRKALEDPKIIKCREWDFCRDNLENDEDDNSPFANPYIVLEIEVAPKEGFKRIDANAVNGLINFQDAVFHELLLMNKRKGKSRKISVGGNKIDAVSEVSFAHPRLIGNDQTLFYIGEITAYEPIGILERSKKYSFNILPEYAKKLNKRTASRVGSTNNYKCALVKQFHISIFPSLEYITKLREIWDEKYNSPKKIKESRLEQLREEEYQIGYANDGTKRIYTVNYNATFDR